MTLNMYRSYRYLAHFNDCITLMWVPAHFAIEGNERADAPVKQEITEEFTVLCQASQV